MEEATEEAQSTLFDITGKEFNPYWVDEKAPLFIPNNPLHWKAHKLQQLITRLEIQAQKNPAQFNSKNYIDALNEFDKLVNEIKQRGTDEDLDARSLAENRDAEATPSLGERVAAGVGFGVSADNPVAG